MHVPVADVIWNFRGHVCSTDMIITIIAMFPRSVYILSYLNGHALLTKIIAPMMF